MPSFWVIGPGDHNSLAIRGETGLEVSESPLLTMLPMNIPALAGLTLVNDQTVTVADLAAFFDITPPASNSSSFLFRYQGQNSALLAPAMVRQIDLADDQLFPLPETIDHELVSGCLVVDDQPMPVIDLRRLLATFTGKQSRPAGTTVKIPTLTGGEKTGWRIVYAAGNKPFALPGQEFSSPLTARPAATAVGRMPAGMIGVCLHHGKPLPLWSLGGLLHDEPSSAEQFMLTGGPQGRQLAIAVEGEGAEIDGGTSSLLPLPPWGRRPGIDKGFVFDGELIPCLEFDALVRGPEQKTGDNSPQPLIPPQGTWEVTEFILAGNRHAVLENEVVDVLPLLPWSRVPGLAPLIRGITCWQEELWPVVDLSCYFDGRLDPAADGGMIALRRGSHRLLLLVDRVTGTKLVEPQAQRLLPLKVPHSLVGGCYLDGTAVVLLINAPAMAHFFDPALVREFCSVLEVTPDSRTEIKAAATAATVSAANIFQPDDVPMDSTVAGDHDEPMRENGNDPPPHVHALEIEEETTASSIPAAEINSESCQRPPLGSDEDAGATTDTIPSPEVNHDQSELFFIADEDIIPEPSPRQEANHNLEPRFIADEDIRPPETSPRPVAKDGASPSVSPQVNKDPASETPGRRAENSGSADYSAFGSRQRRSQRPLFRRLFAGFRAEHHDIKSRVSSSMMFTRRPDQRHNSRRVAIMAGGVLAVGLLAGWWAMSNPPMDSLPQDTLAPESTLDYSGPPPAPEQKEPVKQLAAAALPSPEQQPDFQEEQIQRIKVPETDHRVDPERGHEVPQIAASGTTRRTSVREPTRSPQDEVPRDRLQELPVAAGGETEPPQHDGTSTAARATAATPLDQGAKSATQRPPAIPSGERYVVKKGDSLWRISERFLGEPENYEALARRNGIANPNIIHPGQTLIIEVGP